MRYLMLMWADADAAGGDESDMQAWVDFDEHVKRRPFSEGERQIQAFYIMECDDIESATEWANKLPTHGSVEVRELLPY